MATQAADDGQCTCGMELGKKLKAIEHLVASNPKLVGKGETINVDLRSASPWSSAHTYIEFRSTYGADDKRGVDVRLDAGAQRFTIDGKDGAMRELQATIEHKHLVHMIEDAQKHYDTQAGLDAPWLKDVLDAMKKSADAQKPLDPNVREAWRVLPRAAGIQQKASALYDLLVRIDSSIERWFVPYSGLVASEVEEQLRQAIDEEKRGEIEEARRHLEDIVELAPGHGGAHQALGSLLVNHYAETRLSQAQRSLEKAVQLQPALAVAHQHLADVHFHKGDLPSAKKSYERAVELGRDALALSLFGLGQIAELEQDWQAAKGYYVRSARAENDVAARRVIDLCAVRIDRKVKK